MRDHQPDLIHLGRLVRADMPLTFCNPRHTVAMNFSTGVVFHVPLQVFYRIFFGAS